LGVNLNPTRCCNFDCLYCEVPNRTRDEEQPVNIDQMIDELRDVMTMVSSGALLKQPKFRQLPESLLELRHISISGDGEPTLCPNFLEVLQSLVHFRAMRMFPFFKLILITNGSKLTTPGVIKGIDLMEDHQDELWIKLDAGDQQRFERVNGTRLALEDVLKDIAQIGRNRPVILQSLQTAIDGEGPSPKEIQALVASIRQLQRMGARISMVQIYSATRPVWNSQVSHLKLSNLSAIAHSISKETGLRAQVY